ncbi:hypothetical protein SDC9_181002 [bioreactor metagenome]|uniref:Uncharacterized protein n=1 Tax=bioreactor metagenome TaxID=1076179 RepID=A0A645HBQ0_9ZZZZ
MVVPVVPVAKRYGNERHAVPFHAGNEGAARSFGIARLKSDAAAVHLEQLVVVRHRSSAYAYALRRHYTRKSRVFHGIGSETRHIGCARILFFVVEPARVGERSMSHTELRRLCVHHGDEVVNSAAHGVRYRHRRIVAAAKKQSVKQRLKAHFFARGQVHGRAFGIRALSIHRYYIVAVSVFYGDDGCHYFCRAGYEPLVIGIF